MRSYIMVCITDDTTIVSLELFHNNTPTASVSNYCRFHYTSPWLNIYTLNYLRVLILSYSAWGLWYFIKLQDIFNSIPVIYIWTGLLPKYPKYINYVRVSSYLYLYTHQASNSWSIWNHILLIDLILVLGTLKVPKTITLDYRSRHRFTRMHILYFFRIFSKYAFVIVLIPLFIYLDEFWFLEPMTFHQDHSHWNLRTKLLLQW